MHSPIEALKGAGRSMVVAFSTFSRIPMPQIRWEKANMRWTMCAFVAVGLVVGAAQAGWLALAGQLGLSGFARGVGYVLVAVALTGGIHLDGLADVADAMATHAEPARKVQVMKDPHAGAFALISLCCYLLVWAALAGELAPGSPADWAALGLVPVASRCTAGLASLLLPSADKAGMQQAFREAAGQAGRGPVLLLCAECALAAAALAWARPAFAAAAVLCCAACAGFAARRARREFGGFNGDQAGWLLQACELAMLCALVVLGKVWA